MASEQVFLRPDSDWQVRFDSNWDVLGPFPIHAREQHLLSPAFPLNLSIATDYTKSWPSAYADGGFVNWTKAQSTAEGHLEQLRSTEGWAALQHHAVLRTTVTVHPPSNSKNSSPPQLLVDLKQASYFALRPQEQDISAFVPEWCAGNIYDLERPLPHVVDLPTPPSTKNPTKYDLFVSGDYEIRLFGDPLVRQSEVPVQSITLTLHIQDTRQSLARQGSQDVIPDFLDGYAVGDALGLGIQSTTGWWTAQNVRVRSPSGLELKLLNTITIAPSQTRVIPIEIIQSAPYFDLKDIVIELTFVSENISHVVPISIPINHLQQKASERQSFTATFFYANATPSRFIAIPPFTQGTGGNALPILALHGAGVDIFGHDFWVRSLPQNPVSWIVVPTGRTSWGLDWHGPSADDAWSALEALAIIATRRREKLPDSWEAPSTSKVVVVGHSNGGQGAWYFASRYPDRVMAVVPAAAYIKSQSYIPLTLSRSAHFIDPTLRSILDTAQTPDDNDLLLSNLVDTPILAIHGGDDENVPTWHTREATATLKTWYPSANITYKEDPGEGHWYASVLQNSQVQGFVDSAVSSANEPGDASAFTLTVAIPRESGSLKGWSITRLDIPGRLGRLHVRKIKDGLFVVEPSNIHSFTVPPQHEAYEIIVDDQAVFIPNSQEGTHIQRFAEGQWKV
ncbi:hypothetical protein CVT26_004486 [Gymnopilus dilepis]|uniref:Peptidase S9 prolyl oligopeptidase catalytic domain-containing protein n=1 Tax=Gymnopilus dilepis TaxID=231916 RepID=A0A409W6M1_9AGAR|nr:hypothetical protein CVT26_004486 [Gymnopilus dilepis]